ncbi:pre-piRNA 3'-exonuclease trimmer-like isoform X2 [Periplaneta americana]|uniref:pre-piRNA 3'-exonuclease trimmer-like isoform X2 n=1 Tax=Periplaneta americana TaxID=6978 RepID=UPI0037E85E4F
MSEITRHNFEEKYNEVVEHLKNATVIAVDTEFTGLLSDPEYKPSLFDTGNERYKKLRLSIEQFLVMEVGITTFRCIEDEYKFEANRYTFYIFPRSFASVDNKFMCQASSLEFLCQNNFDFNKFVYDGIPYLNKQQEVHIRKELNEGSLFRNVERTFSMEDEKCVQALCSRVAEWCASAVLGDVLHPEDVVLCQGDERLSYVMHKELRQRFPNIWTYPEKGRVRIEKVSENQRKILEENMNSDKSLEEDIMDSLLGFSRLFKLLTELKKPIVGHNLLVDLMIMYNQFHEHLPTHLTHFKKKIHSLFPVIYDTKFLSFELKKLLKKEDTWDSNVLSNLYLFFKYGRGRHIVLMSPLIQLQNENDQDTQLKVPKCSATGAENYDPSQELDVKFHEAGWDSYCTGYCFIRMAHIFAHVTLGRLIDGRLLSGRELLIGVTSKKNCVNVIRGSVSHMCLDGPDPISQRPRWLHVKSKDFRMIDVSQVAELFAKFGAVDVKPFSRYRALVAVGNHGRSSFTYQ